MNVGSWKNSRSKSTAAVRSFSSHHQNHHDRTLMKIMERSKHDNSNTEDDRLIFNGDEHDGPGVGEFAAAGNYRSIRTWSSFWRRMIPKKKKKNQKVYDHESYLQNFDEGFGKYEDDMNFYRSFSVRFVRPNSYGPWPGVDDL